MTGKIKRIFGNTKYSATSRVSQAHYFLQNADGRFYCLHILYNHTAFTILLTKITITGILTHIINHFSKSCALIIRAVRVTHKKQRHPSGFQKNLFCTQALCHPAQRNNAKQFLTFTRNLSETVFQTDLNASTSLSSSKPSNSR